MMTTTTYLRGKGVVTNPRDEKKKNTRQRRTLWRIRRLKESTQILGYEGFLSRPSREKLPFGICLNT